MLFLFHDHVVKVDLPELRLARRWRAMGCGDPTAIRACDAVQFACETVDAAQQGRVPLEAETELDLAALIIAKTGANAVQFVLQAEGASEPRLSNVPHQALEAFRTAEQRQSNKMARAWSWSAA